MYFGTDMIMRSNMWLSSYAAFSCYNSLWRRFHRVAAWALANFVSFLNQVLIYFRYKSTDQMGIVGHQYRLFLQITYLQNTYSCLHLQLFTKWQSCVIMLCNMHSYDIIFTNLYWTVYPRITPVFDSTTFNMNIINRRSFITHQIYPTMSFHHLLYFELSVDGL